VHLLNIDRNWPVKNALDLLGVHLDLVVANNESKVFNFCLFKLALFQFEIKIMVGKNLKNTMGIVPQVLLVVGKD